jgi:hypothetical protein
MLALVILEIGSLELFAWAGLPFSASQVAKIIGMGHCYPAIFVYLALIIFTFKILFCVHIHSLFFGTGIFKKPFIFI